MGTSDSVSEMNGLARLMPRLLLFTVPLAMAWAGLEWISYGIPNVYSVKRQQVRKISSELETLAVGSSAALYGIAPAELPGRAYNLAHVAQSLYYDDQIVTRLLSELPRLKRVIIAVHYISLFSSLEDVAIERVYYYHQEWHIPPAHCWNYLDVRMWSAVALRSPEKTVTELRAALKRARLGEPLRLPPADPNIDLQGLWRPEHPNPVPADLSEAECERSLAIHHDLMRLSNEPANLAALEHMVSLLRAKEIDVVLTLMPVCHGYFKGVKPEYLNRTDAALTRIARKYQARYFNFLHTPALGAEDFIDVQHLSLNGAVRFTKLLRAAMETTAASE
jgi:hypothetical protein